MVSTKAPYAVYYLVPKRLKTLERDLSTSPSEVRRLALRLFQGGIATAVKNVYRAGRSVTAEYRSFIGQAASLDPSSVLCSQYEIGYASREDAQRRVDFLLRIKRGWDCKARVVDMRTEKVTIDEHEPDDEL